MTQVKQQCCPQCGSSRLDALAVVFPFSRDSYQCDNCWFRGNYTDFFQAPDPRGVSLALKKLSAGLLDAAVAVERLSGELQGKTAVSENVLVEIQALARELATAREIRSQVESSSDRLRRNW